MNPYLLLNSAIVDRMISLPSRSRQISSPLLAAEGRLRGSSATGILLDIGFRKPAARLGRELLTPGEGPRPFLYRDGVITATMDTFIDRTVEWIPVRKRLCAPERPGLRVVGGDQSGGRCAGYYARMNYHAARLSSEESGRQKGLRLLHIFVRIHPNARDKYFAPRAPYRIRKPSRHDLSGFSAADRQESSFLIGDKDMDIECARSAVIKAFLFTSENLCCVLDEVWFARTACTPEDTKNRWTPFPVLSSRVWFPMLHG